MILIIDNYDSFTYNLYQLVGKFNKDVTVRRNDQISIDEIKEMEPSHIILSPGPGNSLNERDFGICRKVLKELKYIPILGVCLGHQGIFTEYGGKIIKSLPKHGKRDEIVHSESSLFNDVPDRFDIIRYHSLICDSSYIPEDINVTSLTDDGIIMSIEHNNYPTFGIQFHPESISGSYGDVIIRNFLEIKG